MFNWLFGKSLEKHLNATKKVRVHGFDFTIKRIDALNYLDGSNIMVKTYALYSKGKGNEVDEISQKKIRKYLSEVLVAGVVSPKISFKDDSGIPVDRLFEDMDLVWGLHEQIYLFTYGKKKLNRYSSAVSG